MKKFLGKAKTVRPLLSGAKYSIDYCRREYRWENKQFVEPVDDLATKFLDDHAAGRARKLVGGYPSEIRPR